MWCRILGCQRGFHIQIRSHSHTRGSMWFLGQQHQKGAEASVDLVWLFSWHRGTRVKGLGTRVGFWPFLTVDEVAFQPVWKVIFFSDLAHLTLFCLFVPLQHMRTMWTSNQSHVNRKETERLRSLFIAGTGHCLQGEDLNPRGAQWCCEDGVVDGSSPARSHIGANLPLLMLQPHILLSVSDLFWNASLAVNTLGLIFYTLSFLLEVYPW